MEKNLPAERDFERLKGVFVFGEERFEDVPLTFRADGRLIEGIPAEFSPLVSERRRDFERKKDVTVITGRNAEGLDIRAEYTLYDGFPVAEWVFFITNAGESDSPVISDLFAGGMILRGRNPVLYHGNGDTCDASGYELWETVLEPGMFEIASDRGVPCFGAFPYFRLTFDGWCANCAVGWSGDWKAVFETGEEGVRLFAGQKRLRTYLKPGETIRTPSLIVMTCDGSADRARNMWRRWYFAQVIPREGEKAIGPMLCLHTWMIDGKQEFCGCTEENQISAIDTYIQKGMKPDVWWIDAGWYRCGYDWTVTGDWRPNPENWPNGLGPVGEKCCENGIKLLLWFEPERVHRGTWLHVNHPEWILEEKEGERLNHPNYMLLNLGDRECLDWVIETVDSYIKEFKVGIYRQDFNFAPAAAWKAAETGNREGAVENAHIQGYYRYWDTLLERNPGLIIDSCSSGGRRNDIETMKRAVTLHYTDVGYGVHPIKQKQHREMFEWIPYFRAHNYNWDDANGDYPPGASRPVDEFGYQCAMAPALTSMVEYYDSAEMFATGNRMTELWRRAAPYMIEGDYYPLTVCRKSNADYYAMQFDVPEKGEGFVQIVRNTKAEPDVFTAEMQADEGLIYSFENGLTGEKFEIPGERLAAEGLTVRIPKRSAVLYFYKARKA